MNVSDSKKVECLLREEGFVPAESMEEADVVLFNTCTVRDHAEGRFLSNLGAVRRLKKKKPSLLVGVLGCVAERMGEEILKRMPHVDFVCGPGRLARLRDVLRGEEGEKVFLGQEEGEDIDEAVPFTDVAGVRSYVAVMRGCNRRCSYCIVPYVRGRERSRKPDEVIREVKVLEAKGVKEVVFLGQSIDRYGKDIGYSLPVLLRRVVEETAVPRIRFVTSHPGGVTQDLAEVMKEYADRICPHVHMPAQSGSTRILRSMRRGYTKESYLSTVTMLRDVVGDVEFSSDFIVGFPGETDDDFRQTCDLVEKVEFLQSFVFKYSPRPSTAAASLKDDVPEEVKKERHRRLLELQNSVTLKKHRLMVGRCLDVLVEGPSKRDPANSVGRSRWNHLVIVRGGGVESGAVYTVEVEECTPLALYGVPVRRVDARA